MADECTEIWDDFDELGHKLSKEETDEIWEYACRAIFGPEDLEMYG